MTIRQGKNVIAGRTELSSTHYLGEWVLSTTAEDVTPEGCIKPDGYEQLDASNSLFADLWNIALKPSPDWRKPFLLPYFTSNSQDGFIVSDSKNNTDIYKVLNGVKSYNIKSGWAGYAIKIQLPNNGALGSYDITASDITPVSYPSAWQIQGSLNGLDWEDVNSVHTQTFKPGETKSYLISSEKQYKYYLIKFVNGVASNNASLLGRVNFHFNKYGTYLDTCSYQEYSEDVRKNGYCVKWAVDYTFEKFKVPFVPDGVSDWKETTVETGKVPVVGNGMTLGLTNGINNIGLGLGYNTPTFGGNTSNYGKPIGTSSSQSTGITTTYGVTSDPKKSGLEADLSNVKTSTNTKFKVRWFIYIASGEIGDFLINWNKLQETLHINNGIEIGDINFTLGIVDERKNLRRKLNGQLMSLDLFPVFAEKIKDLQSISPERFVTEQEWQDELSNSPNKICGKFVLNIANNSVRLPKYPEYLGKEYIKAPVIGNGMTIGLTDGSSNYGMMVNSVNTTLATQPDLYGKPVGTTSGGRAGAYKTYGITKDASKSGIEADLSKSTHESIPVTYYIQVATGSSDRQEIINTIELNNPYSLFDCKWSDHKLENTSWLLSQGQWNNGGVYQSAYNELVKLNNTPKQDGISVKLNTEQFTDYDFVINKTNSTFRLPIKTKVIGGLRDKAPVVGNGKTLGLTDGRNNIAMRTSSAGYPVEVWRVGYGQNVGYPDKPGDASNGTFMGVTKDPTKSGIETDLSNTTNEGLYLYFYVGETVQNANLIDAGRFSDILATKLDGTNVSAYIIKSYIKDTSGYRIWSDGYCEQWGKFLGNTGVRDYKATLLKKFKDTNYNIYSQIILVSGDAQIVFVKHGTVAQNGFTIYQANILDVPNTGIYWQAKGYLAEGEY